MSASFWQMVQSDANAILSGEFGQTVVITRPDGSAHTTTGLGSDTAATLDPSTGELTIGDHHVEVTVRIGPLVDALGSLPVVLPGTANKNAPPRPSWTMTFGGSTYRIKEVHPDRTMGLVTLTGAAQ